jgi:hypothetical protein
MMDIVRALNLYRKSIVDDEIAFEILYFLCKDGATSEPDIERSTGVDPRVLKDVLRELYQANFVRLQPGYRFALTFFGEEALFQTGAGEIVAPFLIDEVISGENASWSRMLAEIAFNAEPERARLATQSLRNLRIFLSHHWDTPKNVRSSLVLNCISPTSSVFGELLVKKLTEGTSENLVFHFFGHGSYEKQWDSLSEYYSEQSPLSRDADKVLLSACSRNPYVGDISDDVARYLSFRVYNYINSSERDSVLEFCYPRTERKSRGTILAIFWEKLSAFFVGQSVRTEQDLSSVLSSAVAEKTKRGSWLQDQMEAKFSTILDEASGHPSAESDLVVVLEKHLGELKRAGLRPGQRLQYARIRELATALEQAANTEGDALQSSGDPPKQSTATRRRRRPAPSVASSGKHPSPKR